MRPVERNTPFRWAVSGRIVEMLDGSGVLRTSGRHGSASFASTFLAGSRKFLRGNDEEAIRLYERSLSRPPYFVVALLNPRPALRRSRTLPDGSILFSACDDFDPTNERALLYFKDIEATHNMHVNEEQARQEARMKQLLGRPVTDFELSVRSRNCLQAMDINTLGDLTEISEQELLAGKNFGETSLTEIRELLTASRTADRSASASNSLAGNLVRPGHVSGRAGDDERPIGDLNLSVRSRKCMTRLNIQTIGQMLHAPPMNCWQAAISE